MGLAKGVGLIFRLCDADPKAITSPNFLVHLEEFITENIESFTRLQLQRLLGIVSRIEKFSKGDGEEGEFSLVFKIEGQINEKQEDARNMRLYDPERQKTQEYVKSYDSEEEFEDGMEAEDIVDS